MIASSVYQSSASKEVNQFDLICSLLREKNFTDAETISMMDFAELERMKPKSALAVRSIPSKSSSNVCGTGNMTHEACVMSKSKSMPNLKDGYKQPEPCYSSLSELSYDMDVEAESCSSFSVLSLGEAANWFYDSSSLNFSHNLSEGEFFDGNFFDRFLRIKTRLGKIYRSKHTRMTEKQRKRANCTFSRITLTFLRISV